MRRLVAKAVAMLAVGSVWLWGQGTTSRVVGTVTDATNAIVPGAQVTLTK